MSKENAKRFILTTEMDPALKSKFGSIMGRQGNERSQDEWDMVIVDEIIPLAKKSGFDFCLADFKEIWRQAGEMTEADLNHVVGGSAVLGSNSYYEDPSTFHSMITGSCEKVLDDSLFEFYFYQNPTDCSIYQWTGNGSDLKACCSCNYRKKQI